MTDILKYDYIVIGSGIAGIRAAIELKKYGSVLILTKSKLYEGSTFHAQGGVAVVISSLDKPKFHFADTINAGAGICQPDAVWRMVEEGPKRIEELIDWGVSFDTKGKQFKLTKEGAHRLSRVLHAGGDATGANIENVLVNKIKNENIDYMEETYVSKLITQDNEVYGAIAYRDKKRFVIFSKAVVVASGGIGQLYDVTTNPPVSTGDGIYFSFLAGANVMDMEFIQFHPTSLAMDTYPKFLISEAVRGEGAILLDENGNRFMEDIHPLKELASRDIVARAIFNHMNSHHVKNVWLDISPIGFDKFEKRFPTIYKKLMELNLCLKGCKIPVSPAAHYFMGGINIDIKGRASLKNLFAAGEVSCSGLHGGNRLASNSLLESLVFAKLVGDSGKFYENTSIREINFIDEPISSAVYDESIVKEIKVIMERNAGIIRKESDLKKNIVFFKDLWSSYRGLSDDNEKNVILKSMIINGLLISQFALNRKESRGAHFRSDFPFLNDIKWKIHQKYSIYDEDLKWIK
ncbi:L-aspartate oxidase [bacterium]|nr:L-aspartate oxidase [bacterium]